MKLALIITQVFAFIETYFFLQFPVTIQWVLLWGLCVLLSAVVTLVYIPTYSAVGSFSQNGYHQKSDRVLVFEEQADTWGVFSDHACVTVIKIVPLIGKRKITAYVIIILSFSLWFQRQAKSAWFLEVWQTSLSSFVRRWKWDTIEKADSQE